MGLKEYLEENRIDLPAIEQMRSRVFIVGKFNRDKRVVEPDIHLFTHFPDKLDAEYKSNFKTVSRINYKEFVSKLAPRVAEAFDDTVPTLHLSKIERPSQDNEAAANGFVLDQYNYFFLRALLSTNQKRFEKELPQLPRGVTPPPDVNSADASARGELVFDQIRKSLRTFCLFQSRNHELIEAFSHVLAKCKHKHGLPPYSQGGAFPGGFQSKLIDFVYAENPQEDFSTKGLQFPAEDEIWSRLASDENAQYGLSKVVQAFRDSLLDEKSTTYNDFKCGAANNSSLFLSNLCNSEIAKTPKLRQDFGDARGAFNSLRQILKSRVLLQMVLEGVVNTLYKVATKGHEHQSEQKQNNLVKKAVADGLLDDSGATLIAPGVKRPTLEARRSFQQAFSQGFNGLIACVTIEQDKQFDKHLKKLPKPLQAVALRLRADNDKLAALRIIAGAVGGEDQAALMKASRGAFEMLIGDIVCPVLYREPKLTDVMLQEIAKSDIMATFLACVFLTKKNEAAFMQLAESKIDDFEKLVTKNGSLERYDAFLASFCEVIVDTVAARDVAQDFKDSLRILAEAQSIIDAADVSTAAGAGSISALDAETSVAADTVPAIEKFEMVYAAAEQETDKLLDESIVEQELPVVAKGKERNTEASKQRFRYDFKTPEIGEGETALRQKIASILDSAATSDKEMLKNLRKPFLPESKHAEDLRIKEQKKKLKADILQKLRSEDNKGFVSQMANDLLAFARTQHRIYSTYKDHLDKKIFARRVERMTLANMMLLFRKEFGIGSETSFLHQLVIDLVGELSGGEGFEDFVKIKSVTQYYDNTALAGPGIISLRQLVAANIVKSMDNIVDIVSDLRGVKYLMDNVKAGEIIVVDASIDEFREWLQRESLEDGRRHRLSDNFVEEHSTNVIKPGLIYFTDAAFPSLDEKASKLELFESLVMRKGTFAYVMPPAVLSVGHFDTEWKAASDKILEAAEHVPFAVLCIGPSPFLNKQGDDFPTYIPAGYLFCAHFLGHSESMIQNINVSSKTSGRLGVLYKQNQAIGSALDFIVWGDDGRSFAVDYYLYVCLSIWSALSTKGADVSKFFSHFMIHQSVAEPSIKAGFATVGVLDKCVLGSNAKRFSILNALTKDSQKDQLTHVAQAEVNDADLRQFIKQLTSPTKAASVPKKQSEDEELGMEGGTRGKIAVLELPYVGWFNRARKRAEL